MSNERGGGDFSHGGLVDLACSWLSRQNCGIVFSDKFGAVVSTGEKPDAIGFRHSVSILVECKATRADFLSDKNKKFRKNPTLGMGDWRFYLSPQGIIEPRDLPEGWGLLHATSRGVRAVHGVPGNARWATHRPFLANKECEMQIMYSALRRFSVRKLFDVVYEKVELTPKK